MKIEVWASGETRTVELDGFLDMLNKGIPEGTLVRCEGMTEFTTPDSARHFLLDKNLCRYRYRFDVDNQQPVYDVVEVVEKKCSTPSKWSRADAESTLGILLIVGGVLMCILSAVLHGDSRIRLAMDLASKGRHDAAAVLVRGEGNDILRQESHRRRHFTFLGGCTIFLAGIGLLACSRLSDIEQAVRKSGVDQPAPKPD